ncbi:MAG: hypothetical protein CFH20_00816 [Alphaproteobacteria bacterium MarineAlpha5_Bin10]|nr:MAG: hypothetical protein CFH20_00816 [Alphaproteobacteria bacterium MarineAlpha5_Bin10]
MWYRKWFHDEAMRLNIHGYVKNSKNYNKVEAVIQGEIESINKIIKLSTIGPPNSSVIKITKILINDNIIYNDFEII